MFKLKNKFALAGLASALLFASAPAAVYAYEDNGHIVLEQNNSDVMTFHAKMKRVSVVNPEIADVSVIDDTTLNVIAKQVGTTSLNVWTADGMMQTFKITVSNEDSYSSKMISDAIKALGIHGVTVKKIADNVVLTGTVENQYEKDLAARTALLYVLKDSTKQYEINEGQGVDGGQAGNTSMTVKENVMSEDNIINMLELRNPDQINISAMIIEIDSDEAQDIGIKYGSDDPAGSPGQFYIGETYGQQRDPGKGWFSRSWLFTHFSQINARIGLAIEKGKARIISQPNITTMSGEEAVIHVGGKFLVKSINSNGSGTVQEIPYGVDLALDKPVLDRQGNITTTLKTSVSTLDWQNQVENIPAVKERTASTVVNIPSGMTMVIGGLMNSEEGKNINKIPILGNIPIIGELFKYSSETNNKSEIMILITPRAVNEHSPVDMSKKMRDMYDNHRRIVEKGEHVDVNDPPGPSEEEKKAAAKAAKEAKDNEGKMLKLNKEAKGEAAEDDAAKAAVRENNAPPVESANSTAPVAADKKDSDKVAGATTVADETAGNAKVTETPSVMGKFLNRRVLK